MRLAGKNIPVELGVLENNAYKLTKVGALGIFDETAKGHLFVVRKADGSWENVEWGSVELKLRKAL